MLWRRAWSNRRGSLRRLSRVRGQSEYASEVFRLLGKKGLTSESSPPVGQAIVESDVGYHIRPGGHSIEMYDWERFLDFADYHFRK